MSDTVITVEHLSKKYLVGHQTGSRGRSRYVALRDVVGREVRNLARKTIDMARGRQVLQGDQVEEFWALKDVSFEVKRGEVLGVIGRNGAGKSTLLKILSRVTEPTEGRVTLRGRVASLLEVGTGFHPELTGRENIYLNGAILGMSRREITAKFDEIVAFAEVEEFVDTPVKHYSSGMYVRLAFAVAAHLEPEILIVDEVLAVGDATFHKKCLGKMSDVAHDGRTVLLVSHDLHKMMLLCDRGILLDGGRIECDSTFAGASDCYQSGLLRASASVSLQVRGDRSGSAEAQFRSIELLRHGRPCHTFAVGDAMTQRIGVDVRKRVGAITVFSCIHSGDGIPVHGFYNDNDGRHWEPSPGSYEFTISIAELRLYPGVYFIELWLGDAATQRIDFIRMAITFHVVQSLTVAQNRPLDRAEGLVYQPAKWTCHPAAPASEPALSTSN